MIQGISHITLIVKDIEKSSLLFQFLFDAVEVYSGDAKKFSVAREKFLTIGDLWIALMEGDSLARSYNHIAFKVPQNHFACLKQRMETLGLEIKESRPRKKEEGESLYFYDYDNHLFEVHSGTLENRLPLYRSVEGIKTCRFVSGKGGGRLWVETLGEEGNPAVILIAGAGAHARFWTNEFCSHLTQEGYFVIRFDHRDTGYSSCDDFEKAPYTVLDLAEDMLSILDAFHIKKAHVVGHSMEGVNAQILASRDSEKTLNFVSISSPTLGPAIRTHQEIMDELLKNKLTAF
jgi:fosfomycin resistance protein FosX